MHACDGAVIDRLKVGDRVLLRISYRYTGLARKWIRRNSEDIYHIESLNGPMTALLTNNNGEQDTVHVSRLVRVPETYSLAETRSIELAQPELVKTFKEICKSFTYSTLIKNRERICKTPAALAVLIMSHVPRASSIELGCLELER